MCLLGALCCALFSTVFSSRATAQIGEIGPAGGPSLGDSGNFTPSRSYGALPIGGWLLYPSLFIGGLYDTNPTQSAIKPSPSFGGRATPSLLAEANDGINKTTLYGMGDFRLYSDPSASGYNTISARTGAIQRYQPTADWVVNAQADYTRQRDLFSTLGIDHSVTTINPTAVGLSPYVNPITYNQYSGLAWAQKRFGAAFVTLGGSAVDIAYDNNTVSVAPSPDGATYTGTARAGLWFTPYLYAYGEGNVDERRYATSEFNSSGYRVIGGIGSDQVRLLKGELFGGYQSENYDFAPFGNVASSIFGGSVSYYPLPYLTLRASMNETLGVSLLAAVPGALGTTTKSDMALFEASYALAREWTASSRFGYVRTNYTGVARTDNAWTGGGTLAYSVWQNFGIALDYQYIQLMSNVPLQSFTRSVVTLGATYRY